MKKCFRAAHGSIFLLKSAENYVMLSLLLKVGGTLQTTAGGSAPLPKGREAHANYFDIPLVWIDIHHSREKVRTATRHGDGSQKL